MCCRSGGISLPTPVLHCSWSRSRRHRVIVRFESPFRAMERPPFGPLGPLGLVPGLVWDAERQRYFCHRPVCSDEPPVSETPSTSSARVEEVPVHEAVASSLSKTVRRKRGRSPTTSFSKPDSEDGGPATTSPTSSQRSQLCAVCLDGFKENQKVFQLPCKHFYHEQCLKPWMQKTGSCPSCRSAIDVAFQTAQKAAHDRWQEQ